MPKRAADTTVSYGIDDTSDDEVSNSSSAILERRGATKTTTMPASDAGIENAQPQKRRGRPKGSVTSSAMKATASKARGPRSSASLVLTKKKAGVTKPSANRQALMELTNAQASDVEGLDDFDALPEDNAPTPKVAATPFITTKAPARRERVAKTREASEKTKTPKAKAVEPIEEEVMQMSVHEIPETQQEDIELHSKLARTQSAAAKEPRQAKRDVISETQFEPMEIVESESLQPTDPVAYLPREIDTKPMPRARSISRQPKASFARHRGGSASDNERVGNDPALRRKLGDMTRKFEALELKYNNLRDLGTGDAETAFDKLKKQTDEKSKAANELMSSLRADLKIQATLASEVNTLKNTINNLTSQQESMMLEKKTLRASLTEAQNEIKTLQAKFAATRSSSTTLQSTENKMPGSAVKTNHMTHRTVMVGSAEAAKEAQKRVLKEELYTDLTGLIIRDVKRREEDGEDIYDCIQTGRNGTLHFHLTVANPGPTCSTNAVSYEDAEFQYTPLLDENRDRDLIEILPDYLTEEICFPRSNAAKFYARVADCMTKRVVEEDEEE